MKRLFALFALGGLLLTGCHKDNPQSAAAFSGTGMVSPEPQPVCDTCGTPGGSKW